MRTASLKLAAFCALFLLPHAARAGTVAHFGAISQISGSGDANLDLAGEMTHAINFSANDPVRHVNGVKFTPDTQLAAGLTAGPNAVTPWQTKPDFGSDFDNDNLEEIYHDIRFAVPPAGQTLEAHLPVTPGQQYKLQLLVYGNHAPDNRRWDIEVEGTMVVDEFTSLGASDASGVLPAYSPSAGVVYTHTLIAADDTLDVRMGNFGGVTDTGPPAPVDRNPVWQGLTVEHIVPDSDSDGLPDAWEESNFIVITAQTGTGDADSDTLSNQFEYQLGSNPNVPDSDGDGLSDSAEYSTHLTNIISADTDGDGLNDGGEITAGSNPLVTDTDGDGLTDGVEVNTHGTSPTDPDSDNDDYSDSIEVTYTTDPTDPDKFPLYSSYNTAFSGGDQDEGLDFDGNIIVAARFGAATMPAGPWPVRDATFVPYFAVPGLTQDAVNEIAPWVNPAFPGPLSANDTNLAEVMKSIRYAGPTINISVPGLTARRSYKVQLLFAEACCANRGFDVYVEGALAANDFAVGVVQGGPSGTPARAAAVIHGFVASDSTLDIRLDRIGVTNPALTDPNAIISALTVEEVPPGADVDDDQLPDDWEIEHFGGIVSYGAADDPDIDGLTNLEELLSGTVPDNPDSDNDGLQDGAELETHQTNPRIADTDSDGLTDGAEVNTTLTDPNDTDSDDDTLSDGAEVNTHGSSPRSIDTDNDGFNDPTELMNAKNPASPASIPDDSHLARVLGADPAEGLDLTGTFAYAFNVGPNGAAGAIHDAVFTADTDPGITVSAPHAIASWVNPGLGSTAADDALEFVFRDIRWADLGNADPAMKYVRVDLANLTPGREYKLQLLFSEQCCPQRIFDVSVEGALLVNDFNMGNAQGPVPMTIAGAAIVHTFTAGDDTLNIVLDGAGVTPFVGYDPNATLSGVTLEEVVTAVPLDIARVTSTPASFTLHVRGTPGRTYSVDHSTDLVTWEEIWDSLVPDAFGDASFTDTLPARIGPAARRGYYRARDPVLDPVP